MVVRRALSIPLAAPADRFEAFETSHLSAIAVLLAGAVVLVWFGRRTRGTPREEVMSRALAVSIVGFTVPLQVLYFTPGYWDLQQTLPLQLCDLAWVTAVVALWSRRPWAVGLTYYWGLTLTTQAIITPALVADFPNPIYVLFWGMHLLVVWAAVYLTWGRGLAPSWRSYRVALAVTATWAVTVFVFNVAAETNYGYLNAKPTTASVLDLLGPWPFYVLAEIAIIAAVWALLTWPWVRPGSGSSPPPLQPPR